LNSSNSKHQKKNETFQIKVSNVIEKIVEFLQFECLSECVWRASFNNDSRICYNSNDSGTIGTLLLLLALLNIQKKERFRKKVRMREMERE
jgi:hypothetical protein